MAIKLPPFDQEPVGHLLVSATSSGQVTIQNIDPVRSDKAILTSEDGRETETVDTGTRRVLHFFELGDLSQVTVNLRLGQSLDIRTRTPQREHGLIIKY